MRILRIKFENLNSLSSGDIDLEHGPLASAGIFAITGPTGAGKSTLLDAITLALYGRAARYDKEPNPENMMSRHKGTCLAEVLFEVPRGRYQARWELRRARGKADGKLQPAKRTVTQDGCGTVLAEKIDDADRILEELTGLDYERFRRSVLLAQGEFTRFLKAKPSERAGLLESLTGTAVYSRLSELAYREATRREDKLAARREALGRVVLLSEEERVLKTTQIERLAGEIEVSGKRRETVTQHLEQGHQLLARRDDETRISAQQAALSQEATQAAPRLEALKMHQSAQPYLGHLQILDDLERRAAAEAAQNDQARAAAAQARLRLASGLSAAQALTRRWIQVSDEALQAANVAAHALREQLSQSESAQEAAAAEATRAASALAKILGGETLESTIAGFAKLEQKRAALVELRTAMEKRDQTADEAARLADLEASLVQEVEAALQEKTATEQEAQAQAALLESARAAVEQQTRIAGMEDQRAQLQPDQPCPLCGALEHPYLHPEALPSIAIEEARRNLNAAKTANDTVAREARVASEGLTRSQERLAGVRKRRGEIRWQQTADHEAYETLARAVRVFTMEALAEAFADLGQARADHEALVQKIRDAESKQHAADKASLAQQNLVSQLRAKLASQQNALAGLTRQRDELCKQAQKLAADPPAEDPLQPAADPELVARYRSRWTTSEEAGTELEQLRSSVTQTAATAEATRKNLEGLQKAVSLQAAELKKALGGTPFADAASLRAARLEEAEAARSAALQSELEARTQALAGQLAHVREQLRGLQDAPAGEALSALEAERKSLEEAIAAATAQHATLGHDLARDDETRRSQAAQLAQWEQEHNELAVWDRLRRLIGSANGAAFQQFAQGLSLDLLVRHANRHLARLSERYRLRRVAGVELTLEIVDCHQADATRPMESLSGGESFLASLALALGLSDLAGRNVRIDSLFIDEGFGSLDSATLDIAVAALESLRLSHKTVGVISHVELLKERIPVQIRVEKRAGGVSVLHVPV